MTLDFLIHLSRPFDQLGIQIGILEEEFIMGIEWSPIEFQCKSLGDGTQIEWLIPLRENLNEFPEPGLNVRGGAQLSLYELPI